MNNVQDPLSANTSLLYIEPLLHSLKITKKDKFRTIKSSDANWPENKFFTPTHNPILLNIWKYQSLKFYHFHWSSKIITNWTNPITHLTWSSKILTNWTNPFTHLTWSSKILTNWTNPITHLTWSSKILTNLYHTYLYQNPITNLTRSSRILRNLPNPITHLIVSSLETTQNNNPDNQIQQFY